MTEHLKTHFMSYQFEKFKARGNIISKFVKIYNLNNEQLFDIFLVDQ